MEENSRVRNIKQKFEDINGNEKIKVASRLPVYKFTLPVSEDNGDSASDLNSNATNHRANIKRTPAFRRDKAVPRACEKPECPKETKSSIVTHRVNHFNNLQTDEPLLQSVNDPSTKIGDVSYISLPKTGPKVAELGVAYAKVKKPQRISKPAVKIKKPVDESTIEYKRQLKHKNQTDSPKKVESSINKENVKKYSPGKLANSQNYDDLSETLKRVLRSPLPPGPPPKKPPRTFTAKPLNHGLVEERKENIFPIPIPVMPKPVRSKTESEIMLKKIENALRRHQNPTSPQLSVRKVSAPDCRTEKYAMINKNGRKSVDRSGTLELCRNSTNGIRSGTQSNTGTSQSRRQTDNHIYEDPKTVVSSDGSPSSEERLRSSLYYMSTPIESIVKPATKPFPNVVEAKNLDVKKPVDILIDDPSSKIPNDISMENKIKIWMDNAYSQPWVKASDGSSDSDSMMSINADDMSPCSPVDTSGEEYDQVTLRRKGYVQKIASKVISRQQSVVSPLPSDYKHLFECLLLIGIDLDARNNKVPYIKMKYPLTADVPQWIEYMCFPDASDWTNSTTERLNNVKEVGEDRSYVVTLTSQAGQRKYVYCRRIKPEGESVSLPLCYCILSPHQAHEFYLMILNELENRHGQSDLKFKKFLKELHDHKFPLRGQCVRINSYAEDGFEKIREDVVERPRDLRLEDLRLAKTLSQLKISTFLTIFSSLLLERKVILLSSQISKLSTCMGGLQAALLPFYWQHTLITAVPSNLISISDLCEAPTPYLIGLLKTKNNENSLLPQFTNKEQIVVVDLDEKKIIRKVGDENSILPSHLAKGIKSALQLAHSSEPRTNNLLACEAFMRLFVELIGHYRRYVRPLNYDCNQRKTFQKEAFVKGSSPHSVRMFLEWFVETASFVTFIELRLANGPDTKGLFEQRCNEYYEELNKSKYSKNKKIVKQIGDFIKDWSITS